MDETTQRAPQDLLKTAVLSLEAEYRAFRRAAEQYCNSTERGFQTAVGLLGESPREPQASVSEPSPLRAKLTNRETQILKLIATGHSTKQIAFLLGIKFKTAVGHRSQLMKRLGIHDTANLVRFAIRTGLVEP